MNKNLEEYLPDGNKAQYRFMKYRIHKILLVCCSYDGYILEEDGHIESQINQEYLDLNMSNPPSFTRVSSTREALELLGRDDSFDFILTMYNVGELDVFSFAKIVKERHAQIPVALLTSFSKDIYRRLEEQDRSGLDYIFGWHGNTDLIMAIIKLVEDKMNAEEDITDGRTQNSSRTPSTSNSRFCASVPGRKSCWPPITRRPWNSTTVTRRTSWA